MSRSSSARCVIEIRSVTPPLIVEGVLLEWGHTPDPWEPTHGDSYLTVVAQHPQVPGTPQRYRLADPVVQGESLEQQRAFVARQQQRAHPVAVVEPGSRSCPVCQVIGSASYCAGCGTHLHARPIEPVCNEAAHTAQQARSAFCPHCGVGVGSGGRPKSRFAPGSSGETERRAEI